MTKALSDARKVRQEVGVQKEFITKIISDCIANTQALKLAEARRKRLERIDIDYADRMQEHAVRKAVLTAAHQSLQQDIAMAKEEMVGEHKIVAEAEREVRMLTSVCQPSVKPNPLIKNLPHYRAAQQSVRRLWRWIICSVV